MHNEKTLIKKPNKVLKWIGIPIVSLLILGFISEQILEFADRQTVLKNPPGQMIQVGDHKMHIYCTGENKNGSPTVILIPGAGNTYFSFDKIQPAISTKTRVCSYDPSGFGFSEGVSDDRTALDISNELKNLLKNANINGPYIIAGHSLGGAYAQVFAHDNPTVKGLVLIDSTCVDQAYVNDPPTPWFVNAINDLLLSSYYVGIPRLVMTISPSFFNIHSDNTKIEKAILAKPFKETNKISIVTGAMNSVDQVKGASYFGNLPVRILEADQSQQQAIEWWGQKLGECHKEMLSFSTQAQYTLVKNSSHDMMDDQSDAVINSIENLLN